MDDATRQALADALAGVNERFARVLADPLTDVEGYDAPFLRQHRIARVDHFTPPREVAFYAGYGPHGRAYLLTGHPEEFVRLAQADGVTIDAPALAADYAVAYLETTRPMSDLFYVVRSVDDLRFRPNLDEGEERERADVVARYEGVVGPPRAETRDGGYAVTAFAVRGQALERHDVRVDRDGSVVDGATTLEEGLPLVYGL